jgi:hypothetical protein
MRYPMPVTMRAASFAATGASYADIPGSDMDLAEQKSTLGIAVSCDAGGQLDVQTIASNDSDYTVSVVVGSATGVASGSTGTITATNLPWRHYKSQAKPTASGEPATGSVWGLAKP